MNAVTSYPWHIGAWQHQKRFGQKRAHPLCTCGNAPNRGSLDLVPIVQLIAVPASTLAPAKFIQHKIGCSVVKAEVVRFLCSDEAIVFLLPSVYFDGVLFRRALLCFSFQTNYANN